jgi:hypothetical protein
MVPSGHETSEHVICIKNEERGREGGKRFLIKSLLPFSFPLSTALILSLSGFIPLSDIL